MEYKDIHQEIYQQPGIRKGHKSIWSSWALTALGGICAYFYFAMPGLSSGLSTWLLGFMSTGIFCFVLILCFYTFGDCRFPYYTPSHRLLEPTCVYYPASAKERLEAALAAKDETALAAITASTLPELVLERFSDKEEEIRYSQLMEMRGGKLCPVSDIYININEKGVK